MNFCDFRHRLVQALPYEYGLCICIVIYCTRQVCNYMTIASAQPYQSFRCIYTTSKKYKFERSTRSSDSRFIKYNAHTHMSTHTNGKNSVFALPRSGPKAQDDERDQALASAAESRIASCESNSLVFGRRLVPSFHSMHLDLREKTGDKSEQLYTFQYRYFYLGPSRNNSWVFICCE